MDPDKHGTEPHQTEATEVGYNPSDSEPQAKKRLSALATLIRVLAVHGITTTRAIASVSGHSERQIWRARQELKGIEPLTLATLTQMSFTGACDGDTCDSGAVVSVRGAVENDTDACGTDPDENVSSSRAHTRAQMESPSGIVLQKEEEAKSRASEREPSELEILTEDLAAVLHGIPPEAITARLRREIEGASVGRVRNAVADIVTKAASGELKSRSLGILAAFVRQAKEPPPPAHKQRVGVDHAWIAHMEEIKRQDKLMLGRH